MQRSTWLRRTALVATLALAVTACGDDGDAGDDATTPDETTTTSDEETTTDAPTSTPTQAAPQNEADGTLQLGYILPETGQLAFLGPPMIESA